MTALEGRGAGLAAAVLLMTAGSAFAQTAGGSAGPPTSADWATPSVVISVISAAIGLVSATTGLVSLMIARRTQTVSFRKDAAAIVRDIKAKKGNAVIQAFENNVARPIAMVLDQIERLTTDMTRLMQAQPADVDAEAKKYASQLAADNANLLRLCREADDGLAGRPAVFLGAYVRALLDTVLFRAGRASLSGSPAAGQSAGAEAMAVVGALKVRLRQLLEGERIALIEAQTGTIVDDPYYSELQKLLGEKFAAASDQTANAAPTVAEG